MRKPFNKFNETVTNSISDKRCEMKKKWEIKFVLSNSKVKTFLFESESREDAIIQLRNKAEQRFIQRIIRVLSKPIDEN
ncbi:MAG: hypothetical protein P8O83_02015, partial [Flavobacteriaceae bacterium]|nr:hypothetical protein [Flavobacteriaceae bacterium]